MCVFVCVCVCVCMSMCVCMCVRVDIVSSMTASDNDTVLGFKALKTGMLLCLIVPC